MANIKEAYAASAPLTLALESLAASSTIVAGRESTAVSNTTNLYLDYLVAGKITTGTTPTAGVVEVWAYASLEDTPTYPDVLDGTDSAETFTSRDILTQSLALMCIINTDSTSNRTYWFRVYSIASIFSRGAGSLFVPKNWGVFVTHNTVAALNATAANHAIWHTGVYLTSV